VTDMTWLQPYPDALLAEIAADQPGPDAVAVSGETISLAFLAAIQLLPPRQRAALILRDVLNWSASEAAAMLDTSVTAANSALQRARATLHDHWPGGRLEWAPAAEPDPEQRRLLRRYITAHEQADAEALVAVLSDDVRLAIPLVGEWNGRTRVATALRDGMNSLGQWRMVPTAANGAPCAAAYLRRPGQDTFHPFGLIVLRVDNGRLVDMVAFEQPSLLRVFGLPDNIAS
jgi:RNA polymerase sigma-70 factor, ECF subfamily